MKLSDIKRDVVAIEQGEWVGDIPEMGTLRLKVRGAYNADWKRIQLKLMDAVPRQKRAGGRIDQDELDRIISICLQSACLLDWDGVQDENGAPLPFSKDLARDLLTDAQWQDFRSAVMWAASQVGSAQAAIVEADTKN